MDDVDSVGLESKRCEEKTLGSLASEELEEVGIKLGKSTGGDRNLVFASEEGLLHDRVSGPLLTGIIISENRKL